MYTTPTNTRENKTLSNEDNMKTRIAAITLLIALIAGPAFAQTTPIMTFYGDVEVSTAASVHLENLTRGGTWTATVGEHMPDAYELTVVDTQGNTAAAVGDMIRLTISDSGGGQIGGSINVTLSPGEIAAALAQIDVMASIPVALVTSNVRFSNGAVNVSWQLIDDVGVTGMRLLRQEAGDPPVAVADWNDIRDGHFADTHVKPGGEYSYLLELTEERVFAYALGSVRVPTSSLALRQNQPNPVTQSTRIGFDLPATGEVTLEVFDVKGRLVRRLVSGTLGAGSREVEWDGRSDRGASVGSGIYFYRIRTASGTLTRKMSVIR